MNTRRGMPIRNNVAIRNKYEDALDQLVRRMRRDTENELRTVFRREPAKKLSKKAKIAIAALLLKFRLLFSELARPRAFSMVSNCERYVTSSVRNSLHTMTDILFDTTRISPAGKDRIEAIVTENVSLINSIPQQYFTQITSEAMQAIATGVLENLEEDIQQQGERVQRRIKTIASDQVSRTIQSLAMQKMIDQGFKKFEWVYTYRSKEPRKSHVAMNSNIYRFDSPPIVNADESKQSPRHGLPGSEINCKCVARPVVEME